MPIIDIIIAVAIIISIIVGFVRGFIKEAISIAARCVRYLGRTVFRSRRGQHFRELAELRGNADLVWPDSYVRDYSCRLADCSAGDYPNSIRMSVLSGMDRFLGSLFGAVRGILLVALFILGGTFAGIFE